MSQKQKWNVVEYYNGEITILHTTDCFDDARETKEWHADQWTDYNAAMKAIKIETA